MVVGLCQWVGSSPFSCRWFGFAGWHWQPIMVHRVRVSAYSPSGREVLRAVAQWVAQGHTCGHRLADAACSRQSGACGARRMCYMVLTCELSWFVVTNPPVRVRRSSAANWGGMVMQEGRGVLASGVLAAGYCCHCRVGWEGMKGPGLFMWCTCCGEGIVLVIWGAGVWEETFGCQTWSGVLRRNGRWLRQHFQELGVSSAGVCWTLLWFGVLGVELVFNSVAGFSGGVSCPSEVRVFTVLWEQGEAVLFSGADLFSLSLPFRLTASQADSGSSSFSHWFSWDHFSQCRPGERWRPRGSSHRSYLCSGRVSACGSRSLLDGSAFHSLCGGLALSWRWVPSRASSWCCVLKSRTAGVFVLFSEAIFCL